MENQIEKIPNFIKDINHLQTIGKANDCLKQLKKNHPIKENFWEGKSSIQDVHDIYWFNRARHLVDCVRKFDNRLCCLEVFFEQTIFELKENSREYLLGNLKIYEGQDQFWKSIQNLKKFVIFALNNKGGYACIGLDRLNQNGNKYKASPIVSRKNAQSLIRLISNKLNESIFPKDHNSSTALKPNLQACNPTMTLSNCIQIQLVPVLNFRYQHIRLRGHEASPQYAVRLKIWPSNTKELYHELNSTGQWPQKYEYKNGKFIISTFHQFYTEFYERNSFLEVNQIHYGCTFNLKPSLH